VADELEVHAAVLEDGGEVGVRLRLHGPVLVDEADHPGGDGAVDGGEVGLHEGLLVGDELRAALVRVGLGRIDEEVDETLIERVENIAVGPRVRAGIEGDRVEAGTVLREVVVAVLEHGHAEAQLAGLVCGVCGGWAV
jgi:hypothetical protein